MPGRHRPVVRLDLQSRRPSQQYREPEGEISSSGRRIGTSNVGRTFSVEISGFVSGALRSG